MAAGEQAIVDLYNGNLKEGVNSLHYKCFYENVAKRTTVVHPQTLSPTSAAAKYHSFRAYVQIQEWKGDISEM